MEFTHFNKDGNAKMVDVSEKKETVRIATATGRITMEPETLQMILDKKAKKGDVLAVAQVAGIMAAKKTSELVPMCHPLLLSGIDVSYSFGTNTIDISATVKLTGQTGVEMEALTCVSVTALTIYDMVKAVDRGMIISDIMLQEKQGGKSGHFKRGEQ